MKKLYKKLGFFILMLMVGHLSMAQSKEAKMVAATNSYNNLKYSDAILQLLPIVAKDSSNTNAVEMLANSYRLTKQYPQALKWYENLSKKSDLKAEWVLRYAEALATDKEYEKSELWYRRYLSMVPSDRRAASFSKADINSFGKESSWTINYLNFNTSASEYSPMLYKNGLVFTSNRYYSKPVKYVFAWNNTPFSDLYYIKDRNSIKESQPSSGDSTITSKTTQGIYNDDNTAPTANDTKIVGVYDRKVYTSIAVNATDEIVPLTDRINTKFHEGPSAVVPEGIIFTRNNYYRSSKSTSKDGKVKLKMFTAKGENLSEIVPFPYNNDQYSVGHPTVSKDGKILIFASDMPGGSGGVDLYYSVRLNEKSEWGRPVNLGRKINTEGDEEFPFLDDDNTLYFSSNGLAGLGGLDVFSIKLKDLQPVGLPKNLGAPFNSPYDDFGVAKTGKLTGYMSSNRLGDDNIYSFVKKEFGIILKGKVTDANTGKPLMLAKVTLRNGDDEEILPLNENGEFEKPLAKDQGYELRGVLKDYLPERRYIGTDGITKDTIIYIPIKLKGVNDLQKFVIDHCDSLKKVFNVDNIYYDLDKYYIRPDAEYNLNKVVDLMTKYPDIKVITRSHCDSRASEAYNRVLSYNRGESAKAYLVKKGIAANRISVEYYGKSRLVNGCTDGVPCSEAQQQMNRRTEFEIVYNGINLALIDCK
ncbi:OmpA family protein [Pedobacter sp. SD-b]|uniref:OmpA family protein n=1 Tax=Pedobacter segetis TaxID=2793069 RepID=A0ABS1BL97_9SPHI|nr:OmpA family protein [Pedobacter segetis]MBK0383672.1 OmpA family protein [Pedobacter segetis]